MSKFKVGNKVRIAKTSQYYVDGNTSNPKDVDGEVIEVRNSPLGGEAYKINVKWSNGRDNTYRESDLELVEPKPEFKVGHGAICIKKTHINRRY